MSGETLTFKQGTMADAPALAAVEAVCFPEAEAAPEAALRERLAHFANHFWLLYQGDRLAGFVNGMVSDEADLLDAMYEEAWRHNEQGAWQMIFGLDVLPCYRRQGYGAKLMHQMIEQAQTEGRRGLVLTCKPRLIHYYARLGFEDEGVSASQHGGVQWHQMRLTF